jgi:hypothetical protein
VKIEFLLHLPETKNPQRCIINVIIDSKLPIYADVEEDFDFPIWIISNSPTVNINIDFVDFLVAKVFCQVVEDWFNNVPELKSPPWIKRLTRFPIEWAFVFDRLGLIGLAAFAATYIMFRGGSLSSLSQLVQLAAAGAILLALTTILTRYLGSQFTRSLHKAVLNSMIVLTKGDERKSIELLDNSGKSFGRLSFYSGTAVFSIVLNVIASYLYYWLSK